MSTIQAQGRAVELSYSTNVHPAESLDDLVRIVNGNVGPVMKGALGPQPSYAVNLRLGMKQVDEILDHGPLPSTSTLSDAILSAAPTPGCEKLKQALAQHSLRVVSVNGFPVLDFHAPRVKEMVYSPPWTDGGRSLYTLKIAKVLTHLMGERSEAAVSVPTGTFKGYTDNEEIKAQCAHFLTECAKELMRLERLTGKTIKLGLEPEPYTTAESMDEFLEYFHKYILVAADEKWPSQLGVSAQKAEELARKFITVNLDLCHSAVEFEDPLEDLKRLQAAGISITGLHLSAALKLPEPAQNAAALEQLLSMNEPRYLHQVVGRLRDGGLARFEDLPDLDRLRTRPRGFKIADFEELRCHFHVPLFAAWPGPLASTRDGVGPAARYAAKEGLTDNLIVETYTWGVLNDLAAKGVPAAKEIVGSGPAVDVNAGLMREIQWAKAEITA
ncbi:MAG: metabolite traffic protein EboE [Planctomycetota bacterium]|nr:metabolite traffic protein EboE [Planctomycetota bacterium]